MDHVLDGFLSGMMIAVVPVALVLTEIFFQEY